MMNRLQSLFNRLAGIQDQATLALAESGFPAQAFAALEKPACWRRRPRRQPTAAGTR